MPQMMPLSWLTLYLFFILMFSMFSFINYYSFINKPAILLTSLNIKSLTWKW